LVLPQQQQAEHRVKEMLEAEVTGLAPHLLDGLVVAVAVLEQREVMLL
jgi:hypothetical protein